MVSPGELRLIDELAAKDDEFSPEMTDSGAVSYPGVAQILDDTDDDPVDVLERFVDHGILTDEFVSKVYVCPECAAEGMQYTSICPTCESARAVETTILEHSCGYAGPEKEFRLDGQHYCPNCEMDIQAGSITTEERYACPECLEIFDVPDGRLWCRGCLYMFPPEETIEQVLYRYSLLPEGEHWLNRHRSARQAIAEALQERHFETTIDATVTDGVETRSVHVLAEDGLMGDQRLVAIYETPDTDSVDRFDTFAKSIGAHSVIVTTSGAVEEGVAARAEETELKLITFKEDGTLSPDYEIIESAAAHRQGLLQRLTGAMSGSGRKRE
jgi:hypothetical protein